jgi:hypothetical protein
MTDEWITLWTYSDPAEAFVAEGKLESEGIECSLVQEDPSGNLSLLPEDRGGMSWAHFMGGIQLQVDKKDAEAAMAILREGIPPTIVYEEGQEEYRQPECPNCHSLDVSSETVSSADSGRYSGQSGSGIRLGITYTDLWKCEACGHKWQAEKD